MRYPVLQRLIAPIEPSQFLKTHWGRRSIHVAGKERRLDDLPPDDTWFDHATEIDAASVDAAGRQRQVRIAPAQVSALYSGGLTICANVSQHPVVSALLTQFAFELGLPGTPFAKLYSSPDDKGFALHFDSHHVFVVQLSGTKRWRFSSSPVVDAPLASGKLDERGQPVWSIDGADEPITADDGEPIDAPDVSTFDEAELTPGDVLYLPPGCWHCARARGHSVGLSISPPRTSLFSLMSRALEDHLERRAEWRRDVFTDIPFDGSGRLPEPLVQQFDGAVSSLRSLLDTFDVRTLHRVWSMNIVRPAFTTEGPAHAGPIARDEVFVHHGTGVSRYLLASEPGGHEAIYFYAANEEMSLARDALMFVEGLARSPRFVAGEACKWDEKLSWTEVETLLRQLLEAGLIRRGR